jgi:3-oxoacyl-[acyl-carrier protein] reductase
VSDLQGRVALVTGASGGIGGALSARLAGAGARVALHYGSHREAAEELRQRLGGDTVAVGADLRDPKAPARLVDEVEDALGPVEILAANAGLSVHQTLDEVDLVLWDETQAVNLRAPFLLAQRVAPGMRERGFGRILFTSSVAAFTGGIVGPHYASSKAGLHGLVHFLAARLAGSGVTVNAIAPALIEETRMLPGNRDDPSWGDLSQRIPVGRLGKPAEVADLMLAMLGNGYLTNQVVSLDGGLHPR